MALQVPRILNPVVLVLEQLPSLCRDAQLLSYVTAVFGSLEGCRCGWSRAYSGVKRRIYAYDEGGPEALSEICFCAVNGFKDLPLQSK